MRRISVAACIKRAFEWDKPCFEPNLAERKPFEELFATFVIGLKMKTENTTRQECRLPFFDLLFLLSGSLTLAQKQRRLPRARAAAWNTFHSASRRGPACTPARKKACGSSLVLSPPPPRKQA